MNAQLAVMSVEISIGCYVIRPHPVPDGRVFVEVQRLDDQDAHDHWHGPSLVLDLDQLFVKELQANKERTISNGQNVD